MAKSATLKLRDGTAKQFMTTAVTETLSTIFYFPRAFFSLLVLFRYDLPKAMVNYSVSRSQVAEI